MQIRLSPNAVQKLEAVRQQYLRIAPYITVSLTKIGEKLISQEADRELSRLKTIKTNDHAKSKEHISKLLRH